MSSEDLDLEERQLCPDGACIGVIGDDGRCGECGREAEDAVDDDDLEVEADAAQAEVAAPAGPGEAAPDDDDRRLCPDGACIGLIGADGRCKVCGLPASS